MRLSRRSMFCLPLLGLAPIKKPFRYRPIYGPETRWYSDHKFSRLFTIKFDPLPDTWMDRPWGEASREERHK